MTNSEHKRLTWVLKSHWQGVYFRVVHDQQHKTNQLEWFGRPAIDKVESVLRKENLWGPDQISGVHWARSAGVEVSL